MAEDLRRLFEQGGDEQPVLTRRVAWGLAGTATKNSTWQTIVTWLQGVLNFLKPANNLSDVFDPAAALSNIGGIGASALNGYALKSTVLELNNTVEFIPDNPYEPATKKYVDDKTSTIRVFQNNTTSVHAVADVVWSKNGKVINIYGEFTTDGTDGFLPGGVTFASAPVGFFTSPIPSDARPVALTTRATGDTIYVFISGFGDLMYVGEIDGGIPYRFNLTYIEQ